MCGCQKNNGLLPETAPAAIADLKTQRSEFEVRAAAGDRTVEASIAFIDNVLSVYGHGCKCKKTHD